jgi:hypothetical protein
VRPLQSLALGGRNIRTSRPRSPPESLSSQKLALSPGFVACFPPRPAVVTVSEKALPRQECNRARAHQSDDFMFSLLSQAVVFPYAKKKLWFSRNHYNPQVPE